MPGKSWQEASPGDLMIHTRENIKFVKNRTLRRNEVIILLHISSPQNILHLYCTFPVPRKAANRRKIFEITKTAINGVRGKKCIIVQAASSIGRKEQC